MRNPDELYDQGVLWFKVGEYEKAKGVWFEAAKNNNSGAMFCLAIYYLSSDHYDLEKAIYWFENAAKEGHKNAGIQLEMLKNDVDGTRSKLATRFFLRNRTENDSDKCKDSVKVIGGYEWIVLEEEKECELLLSKYIIDIRKYNEEEKSVDWSGCSLRKWLNEEFINGFTDEELEKIIISKIINTDNIEYDIRGGRNTYDRIFLLSFDELRKYYGSKMKESQEIDLLEEKDDNPSLVAYVNIPPEDLELAKKRTNLDFSLINGSSMGWWLRTPGSSQKKAMRVNCNGAIRKYGRDVNKKLVGVRPAMRVKK